MNVHKRCEKNVSNTCGIDTKKFGEVLLGLGISSDRTTGSSRKEPRKKNSATIQSPNKSYASPFSERSHTSPLPSMSDPMCSYDNITHVMNDMHLSKKEYYPGFGMDDNSNQRYSLNSFNFIKVLGKGSFGKVIPLITRRFHRCWSNWMFPFHSISSHLIGWRSCWPNWKIRTRYMP